MKKTLSFFLALLLLFALSACSENKAKRKSQDDDYDEITEKEDDAYDLFNEALVNLMEQKAYDIALSADILSDGSTSTVEMAYQFSDDNENCRYYSHESMGGMLTTDTYYADGMLVTVTGIPLIGQELVSAEEMDRDTFLTENGNPVTMLATFNVPREAFTGAEITEKDGITSVVLTVSGITELPEEIAGIANTLFDLENATDIYYDTAVFTFNLTEDATLSSLRLASGMDYTDANGNDVSVDLNLTVTVNKVDESFTVKAFEGEIPEPGETNPGTDSPSFDIGDYYDLIPEEYRGLFKP